MVEHSAVNRRVAGSSPARGAKKSRHKSGFSILNHAEINMPFYVYALHSPSFNKIYIGQTTDIERRVGEHNKGESTYTRKFTPWVLVYSEECESRGNAMKRERQLKSSKGREFIWNLINDGDRQPTD